MAESEKNSVDETCSHMDDDPCLKRSKSIDIIKEPRFHRLATTNRGFTEDMAFCTDVIGSYDVRGKPETVESPTPRDSFVPPHLAQYSSSDDSYLSL